MTWPNALFGSEPKVDPQKQVNIMPDANLNHPGTKKAFSLQNIIGKIHRMAWLAVLAALLGGLLFAAQSWQYAHQQSSIVDEGAFLYLGYRFLNGTGASYAHLGLWNNYPPLSFVIPGMVQNLIGPGLRTGRYFAILVGLLMLVALWICARRLGGKWWAAAAVWAVALAPMQIKMYSLGMSQVLAACFLTWTLALILGEERPFWQITAGSLLAGLTVMTRQNLLPLIPLTIGYIFWQHGRKAGWWSIAASLLPVLIATIAYWPNILRLWSFNWLPHLWLPFLSQFGPPPGTLPGGDWGNTANIYGRMAAFFMAFRVHYTVLVGVSACFLLWPRKWVHREQMRTGVFLAALFVSLFLLHAWFTLGLGPCPTCFAPYTAFFSDVALLLIVVSFTSWVPKPSIPRQILIIIFLLFVSLGLGQATFDRLGPWILSLPVPRISGGLHLGAWVTLWDYIGNKLHLDYFIARSILPPFFGLAVGGLLILAVFVGFRFLLRRSGEARRSFGSVVLTVFLLVGCFISPLMNGDYRQDGDCSKDVIANYEMVGQELAGLVPAGSKIYWVVPSAVPLLYLPDANLHLAQVYGVYSYRVGGSPDDVEEHGYWNEELARRWMAEADFLVVEEDSLAYTPSPGDVLNLASYTQTILPPVNPCKSDTRLFVYRHSP